MDYNAIILLAVLMVAPYYLLRYFEWKERRQAPLFEIFNTVDAKTLGFVRGEARAKAICETFGSSYDYEQAKVFEA